MLKGLLVPRGCLVEKLKMCHCFSGMEVEEDDSMSKVFMKRYTSGLYDTVTLTRCIFSTVAVPAKQILANI